MRRRPVAVSVGVGVGVAVGGWTYWTTSDLFAAVFLAVLYAGVGYAMTWESQTHSDGGESRARSRWSGLFCGFLGGMGPLVVALFPVPAAYELVLVLFVFGVAVIAAFLGIRMGMEMERPFDGQPD